MIERPTNWNEVREFSERRELELGAYVCKIKQAGVHTNADGSQPGAQLCIVFDITEGDYTGFYAANFAANTREDKKWKGVLRLFLPRNDGSDKDEWTKSTLKGFCTAVEKSNPGYQWNWDENSLKGKNIGILFRNEQWAYNGKTGWAVRPFRALSVDTVRNGDYKIPDDKPLSPETNINTAYARGGFYAPTPAPAYQQPSNNGLPAFDGMADDDNVPF